MRVLHVNQIAQLQGGVERILLDTARGLTERGSPQALLHVEPEADIRMLSAFELASTDLSIIDQFKPDVVLVHKADAALIEQLSARAPTLRMVHDHDLVCMRRHKYFPISKTICERPAGLGCLTHLCAVQPNRSGQGLPIKLASLRAQLNSIKINRKLERLIVGSEWMRQSLLTNGFNESQLAIVPPVPSSLDQIEPVEPLVPVKGAAEFLYVGQLLRGKGIDLMLRACAELKGDWRLRIVGDGNFRSEAEAWIRRLKIEDSVEFTGWVEHEELDRYYQSSRALVVPSRWPEPFGMVGVEAMARGRPVVGFASGGIPDWLAHEVSGLLADAGDVTGMTFALQRLVDDLPLAARLSAGAAERYQRQYGHQRYLDQLQQVLERAA